MGRATGIPRTERLGAATRLLGAVAIIVAASIASGVALLSPIEPSPTDPPPADSAPEFPPPLALLVTSVDGGIVVSYTDFQSHWGHGADFTADGVTWTPWCGPSVGTPCDEPRYSYTPDQTLVCVPSQPNTCFINWTSGIGVERSDDGGVSWHYEWSLTWEERARINDATGGIYSPDMVATASLGILDLPSGFLVIAANGPDGIALRHPDGTWERRGFLDSSCCRAKGVEYPPVDISAPIPDTLEQDPAEALPYSAVAVGAGFAVAAWWIAFEVALFASRTRAEKPRGSRGRTGRALRWAASGVLLAMGLAAFGLLSVSLAQAIDDSRERALNPPMDATVVGVLMYPIGFTVLVVAGGLLSLAARSAAPLRPRSDAWRTWLGAGASAAIAMTAALVAGRTAHYSWVVGVATGATLLATLVPAVVLSRRAEDRRQAAVAARWRDPWRGEEG